MSSFVIHPIHARPKTKGDKEFSVFNRRCRMTFANAPHTGSSAVRGKGLLGVGNGTGFNEKS
jgi:hypothetical protein